MSKTIRITGRVEHKTRVHRVLFDRDMPFRPKAVDLKTRYRRRDKHQNRSFDTI